MARHLRGFTQKKSADRLGIAQAVYSRMENDLVEIDEKMLKRVSTVFRLPVEFFDQHEPVYGPPVSVHTMLRGPSQISARDVDMITAELNLRLMHLRRFLDNVEFNPSLHLPQFDIEAFDSPTQIAVMVRRHWKVPAGPVKNLTRLLERAGVIVSFSEFNGAGTDNSKRQGSGVSGVTFSAPGQPPLILLNPNHPADRVRFTLAHELGHLVMHRFPTPAMEKEANEFASAFLLPPDELRSVCRGRKVDLALLGTLKLEWKISMQGILYAIQREGIITKNQANYLWKQISAKGWRTREPASLDFEHDLPRVMPTIVKSHLEDLGFDKEELASLARVHEQELDGLYPFGNEESEGRTRPTLRIVN